MMFINSMDRLTVIDCVGRQNYGTAYFAQKYAVIGVVPSAVIALAALVIGVAKAILSVIYPEYTYYNAFEERNVSYKEDARDLGILFLNNIWNILSLGILNPIAFQTSAYEERLAFQLEFLETHVPGNHPIKTKEDLLSAFDRLQVHKDADTLIQVLSTMKSRTMNDCFSNRVSSSPRFGRVGNKTYKQVRTITSGVKKETPRGQQPGDNYQILGIEPTASAREIKAAYRELSFMYHPDKIKQKQGESEEAFLARKAAAPNEFATIHNAYEAITEAS
jgi:DnaJ-domain-containing protein 1